MFNGNLSRKDNLVNQDKKNTSKETISEKKEIKIENENNGSNKETIVVNEKKKEEPITPKKLNFAEQLLNRIP